MKMDNIFVKIYVLALGHSLGLEPQVSKLAGLDLGLGMGKIIGSWSRSPGL